MDKKYLERYLENKVRIKINLKNGYFYEGVILSIENNIVLFRDKYSDEIPIDLDSISYVIPVKNGGRNEI